MDVPPNSRASAAEPADLDAVADVTEIQIFLAKEQEAIEPHHLGRHVAVNGIAARRRTRGGKFSNVVMDTVRIPPSSGAQARRCRNKGFSNCAWGSYLFFSIRPSTIFRIRT